MSAARDAAELPDPVLVPLAGYCAVCAHTVRGMAIYPAFRHIVHRAPLRHCTTTNPVVPTKNREVVHNGQSVGQPAQG